MSHALKATCHDCGVREGQIHDFGCDMEKCPTCGGQLITCDCHASLKSVEKKGRIPWIQWPNLCAKCGKLWPKMFMVPDTEWRRYIERGRRHEVLCLDCYEAIKDAIDTAAKARTSRR